jgi:aryl-alcohol dehydrogenase-like predicted oxidoreductase
MQKRRLGQTDIMVTSVCLGTMTWGQQNSEEQAHAQLDYALGRGINFIDTAEMYPVPGKAETQGRTESYIGSWLAARKNRDQYILATKIAGRSGMSWCRDKDKMTRHTSAQIDEAIEKSLRRLNTDYIDLYQLHWPDRDLIGNGFLFHSYYDYDTADMVPIEETLSALARHIEKGNIRHYGLSNESAWGAMKTLQIADKMGLPRPVSHQHIYSLLSRRYDYEQAEISMREDMGLLAYSPLAMGLLTGKYDDGKLPDGSRKALFKGFMGRYEGIETEAKACNEAAKDLGLTPTQFALKFVETRDFVTSNIIGATTMAQLKDNIDAHDVTWTNEMEAAAHALHARLRSPVPSPS